MQFRNVLLEYKLDESRAYSDILLVGIGQCQLTELLKQFSIYLFNDHFLCFMLTKD